MEEGNAGLPKEKNSGTRHYMRNFMYETPFTEFYLTLFFMKCAIIILSALVVLESRITPFIFVCSSPNLLIVVKSIKYHLISCIVLSILMIPLIKGIY